MACCGSFRSCMFQPPAFLLGPLSTFLFFFRRLKNSCFNIQNTKSRYDIKYWMRHCLHQWHGSYDWSTLYRAYSRWSHADIEVRFINKDTILQKKKAPCHFLPTDLHKLGASQLYPRHFLTTGWSVTFFHC